jgi:hypothetical protein
LDSFFGLPGLLKVIFFAAYFLRSDSSEGDRVCEFWLPIPSSTLVAVETFLAPFGEYRYGVFF